MTTARTLLAVAVLTALPSLATAQDPPPRDFGKAYSFAERKPRTKVEQTIDKLLPSIVKIVGASGLSTITPYASGVIVSEQGHILTLDQVMIQKGGTRVVLYDGSVHDAELLPEAPKLGVRLLKIDPKECDGKLQALWPPQDDKPPFTTGEFVISLGNAFRLAEFSEKVGATFGVVVGRADTALRYRMTDVKYDGDLILTDACNNQGQYGGGLFALDGRWIGLNMRLLKSNETNTWVSAAIPTRDLLPYLDEQIRGVVATEKPVEHKPVSTGAVLFEPPGRQSPPAYVERVQAGSPAAAIGLRADDLIVRIDDFSIRSCRELREILAKFEPGQKVKVTWKRGTQILDAELTLAEGEAK